MPKRSARMTKKRSSKKRSYKKRQYKKGGAKGGLSDSDYWNREKAARRPSRRQRSADLSEEAKRRMRQRSPSPKKK